MRGNAPVRVGFRAGFRSGRTPFVLVAVLGAMSVPSAAVVSESGVLVEPVAAAEVVVVALGETAAAVVFVSVSVVATPPCDWRRGLAWSLSGSLSRVVQVGCSPPDLSLAVSLSWPCC